MIRYSKDHQHEPRPEGRSIRVHSKKLSLRQFHLVCLIGLASVLTAFSGRAESVQTNAGARPDHSDLYTDLGATFMARDGGYAVIDERPAITSAMKPANVAKPAGRVAGLQPVAQPNTGVLILGGLALLLWIQRFRKYRFK